jgi:hypothetical protein
MGLTTTTAAIIAAVPIGLALRRGDKPRQRPELQRFVTREPATLAG